ncbi:hypothetical protein EAO75_35840 [Streptomyces sp. uw30]|nr:hypothetical protein EAO75_35840 [Streptomyces sp. uw30]
MPTLRPTRRRRPPRDTRRRGGAGRRGTWGPRTPPRRARGYRGRASRWRSPGRTAVRCVGRS